MINDKKAPRKTIRRKHLESAKEKGGDKLTFDEREALYFEGIEFMYGQDYHAAISTSMMTGKEAYANLVYRTAELREHLIGSDKSLTQDIARLSTLGKRISDCSYPPRRKEGKSE